MEPREKLESLRKEWQSLVMNGSDEMVKKSGQILMGIEDAKKAVYLEDLELSIRALKAGLEAKDFIHIKGTFSTTGWSLACYAANPTARSAARFLVDALTRLYELESGKQWTDNRSPNP